MNARRMWPGARGSGYERGALKSGQAIIRRGRGGEAQGEHGLLQARARIGAQSGDLGPHDPLRRAAVTAEPHDILRQHDQREEVKVTGRIGTNPAGGVIVALADVEVPAAAALRGRGLDLQFQHCRRMQDQARQLCRNGAG